MTARMDPVTVDGVRGGGWIRLADNGGDTLQVTTARYPCEFDPAALDDLIAALAERRAVIGERADDAGKTYADEAEDGDRAVTRRGSYVVEFGELRRVDE